MTMYHTIHYRLLSLAGSRHDSTSRMAIDQYLDFKEPGDRRMLWKESARDIGADANALRKVSNTFFV